MSPISRRTVLKSTAGAALLANHATAGSSARLNIVDTNVSLFDWPFRRLPLHDSASLVNRLTDLGIQEAWVGSFEAILHRDVEQVNQRLVAECVRYPSLVPMGCVNLSLPGWQQDLQFCVQNPSVAGVRLLPAYHGYGLEAESFRQLLAVCSRTQMLVQICVSLEDVRTQHPLVKVPDVDLSPLLNPKQDLPPTRVQLLNLKPSAAVLHQLATRREICVDTARADGTDAVPELTKALGDQRVLFGSHAPFLIPEAALIRVFESQQLTPSEIERLLSGNAGRWRLPGAMQEAVR